MASNKTALGSRSGGRADLSRTEPHGHQTRSLTYALQQQSSPRSHPVACHAAPAAAAAGLTQHNLTQWHLNCELRWTAGQENKERERNGEGERCNPQQRLCALCYASVGVFFFALSTAPKTDIIFIESHVFPNHVQRGRDSPDRFVGSAKRLNQTLAVCGTSCDGVTD